MPISEEEFEQLVAFFKVMADKSRLRILGLLSSQECTVEELAAILGLKEPTISHHLAKLKDAGLAQMRPAGTTHYYTLNQDTLSQTLRRLSPKVIQETAETLDGNEFERKVQQSFFIEGRLKEIPAQLKKRQVILRKLVQEFEAGKQYTEKQVNDILLRYHEDSATLRREFIGNKLMARENGLYWRI